MVWIFKKVIVPRLYQYLLDCLFVCILSQGRLTSHGVVVNSVRFHGFVEKREDLTGYSLLFLRLSVLRHFFHRFLTIVKHYAVLQKEKEVH